MLFDYREMTPILNKNSEAFQDLPVEMQVILKSYETSRSLGDLDAVISSMLMDLGANLGDDKLSDETNFIQDLGLDSLAIAEFVFFFEDLFNIKISNLELATINNLGELKLFIQGKLA